MADNALNPANVTLAVLAGGQGRRMGLPKSQLRVGGKPLLTWLMDRWRWPGPTMLITAPGNERPPGCECFSGERVDPVADEGPLRGLITALEGATTTYLLVTPCDMPFVKHTQFQTLLEALGRSPNPSGAVFARGIDDRACIEPFPMAISRKLLTATREAFAAGERSPTRLAMNVGFDAVPDIAPEDAWLNLNSPADYQSFVARLQD